MELLAPAGSPEALTAAVQAGADAVLVSHNIAASMDESLPASLSPTVPPTQALPRE